MKLFRKCFLLAFLSFAVRLAQAQFADGTGTGLHQDKIFWLEWGGSTLNSTPPGFTPTNIVEGTYVWNVEPGVSRVVGVISQITTVEAPTNGATLSLSPYNSGQWTGNGTSSLGDGLQLMYPGINPIGIATSLNGAAVPTSVFRGVVKFDISLQLQMLIDGVWTDLNYPGMIVADAESMNATTTVTEYISAKTTGSSGWQILDIRNDAASIGKDPTKYKLEIGSGGSYFKLYNDLVNDMGVQAVMYAHGTTSLTDVQMKGRGITALALGFIAPFDYGDAPASYGDAIHYMDDLALNGTVLRADGTYSVSELAIASLVTPTANVYIHELPDPDGGLMHYSPNADIDEDTQLPQYDGSGTYSFTSPITNNTGLPTQIGAWIDWNNNGVFDTSEGILQTLPPSATSATFTWAGVTTNPDPAINYFARVRITTDLLTSPAGGATNGEVEDYAIKARYSLSGHVFDDGDGLTDNTVDGTGTNLGGVLYANLINGLGVVVATTPVQNDGTYGFFGALSGTYTVQVTTTPGTVGVPSPAVDLPTGWVSTGENLGSNAGNDGQVNSVLSISISDGVVITDANFGIDKLPVADDKNYSIITPAPNSFLTLNGTGASNSPGPLSGTDLEDGLLGSTNRVIFTDLTALNGNELYYGGTLVTAGSEIGNYDPSLLSIKFTSLGSTSASFEYTFTDAAEQSGIPAKYTIAWASPLPVKLIGFAASKAENAVALSWTTATEANSDRFEIERSADGKTWEKIGVVDAQGESTVNVQYTFKDVNAMEGNNYYRLKMIDSDMTFALSGIRSVSFEGNFQSYFFPNPVTDKLNVKISDPAKVHRIQISNMAGAVVYHSKEILSNTVDVRFLPEGIYILSIFHQNGTVYSHKVIHRK